MTPAELMQGTVTALQNHARTLSDDTTLQNGREEGRIVAEAKVEAEAKFEIKVEPQLMVELVPENYPSAVKDGEVTQDIKAEVEEALADPEATTPQQFTSAPCTGSITEPDPNAEVEAEAEVESEAFRCPVCTFTCNYVKDLISHHSLAHSAELDPDTSRKEPFHNKLHSCTHCPYQSNHKSNMARHLQIKHGPSVSEALENFKASKIEKDKLKSYKCSLCNFDSKYKHTLLRHIENLHGSIEALKYRDTSRKEQFHNKLHICTRCHFGSNYKDSLVRHIQLKHPNSKKEVQIDPNDIQTERKDSPKPFASKHSIERVHKRTVAGHSKCSDRTNQKKLMHIGKRFVCNICDYRTYNEDRLGVHVKAVHTLLKCNSCDYKTSVKRDLKRHTQTHDTATGSFQCVICSKSFTRSDNLNRHLKRVHIM